MNVRDTVVLALRTVRASRLRTALTALGITIGIAAVVLLVGLGNGLQESLDRNASRTAKVIVVSTGLGEVPGARITRRLTEEDAAALEDRSRAPAISGVVQMFSASSVLHNQEKTVSTTVYGVAGPNILGATTQRLAVGSPLDEAESRGAAKVVVLGQGTVDALFNGDANRAIGQQVVIGRMPFRVIGVMQRSSVADRWAFIPLRSARALVGGVNRLTLMRVVADSVQNVPATMGQINEVMDAQHQIEEPGLRDYILQASLTRVQKLQGYLDQLKLFVIGIAGLSLLVGAVGVANIMLISVHERRREIGIRRAVGAPRSAIVRQVLAESTLIAGLGGLAGIALGVGLTRLAAAYLPARLPDFGTPTVSITALLIAAGVSVGIGTLAGLPPARRAARMQPVDALRG